MKNKILFILVALFALAVTMTSALAAEAPEITSTAQTTATVGQQYTYQVTNSAADNGTISYSLLTAPTGMSITSAGLITWTPSAAGTEAVIVNVSDSNSSNTQSFNIVVSTTPGQFVAGDVTLGSDTQKRGQNIAATVWKVTNGGSETISNINVTITTNDPTYNLTATLPSTTLAGFQSMDVVFNGYVPEDQDAGNIIINSVQLTGTGAASVTKNVYLETENNLVIDRVEVRVAGSKDTLNSPGSVDKEAEYDDEIEITVRVENTFSSNIKIKDINVELDANDLDPADGLDDSLSSLNDGDKDEAVLSFVMDIDDINAGDAPFTITIKVDGEDENGAAHQDEWDIELDMNTRSRDVRFANAALGSTIVKCGDDLRINYDLKNVGTRDLNDAMVLAEIEDLGIRVWTRNIEVDEGDSDEQIARLNIPKSAKPGEYFVKLTGYADDNTNADTDLEALDFQVTCGETTTTTTTTTTNNPKTGITVKETTTTVKPPVDTTTGVPVATSTGTRSSSLRDASTYLIVLGVLVVVLLAVVLLLIFKVTQK